ncbi:MAG: hypothetical protein KF758_10035 [Anaerolineales bacterium]|nr:hypothetical protein [Anaerolineales bacterium]
MVIKHLPKVILKKHIQVALKKTHRKKKTRLTLAKKEKIKKVFGMWANRSGITDNWLAEGRVNLKSNWKEE